MAYGKKGRLGIGDKPGSGSADSLGLLDKKGVSNKQKLRGETSIMEQRPTLKKATIKSDRGSFKCC